MAKSMHYGQQCRNGSAGDYGNVPKDNHQHHLRGGIVNTRGGPGIAVGCHRPPSIASCSSIYETIVESVNKFPMQTMHSNKTCKYTHVGLKQDVDGRTRLDVIYGVGPRTSCSFVRDVVKHIINNLDECFSILFFLLDSTAVKSPPEHIYLCI